MKFRKGSSIFPNPTIQNELHDYGYLANLVHETILNNDSN